MDQRLGESHDWQEIVSRLGGAEAVAASARETKAFLRPRVIGNPVDLLRVILAYCLGAGGLRSTAAWAASVGLVDISKVALLQRLRRCGSWLEVLVGKALAAGAPKASHGRLIRLIDATSVPRAGKIARSNGVWRIHSAFDLPSERFGFFELTDQQGGETLDRIPAIKGEIRIGDRAYLQPDRIASILEAGADILVRAPWKGASWRDGNDKSFDLIAGLRDAATAIIDQLIGIGRKSGATYRLRLVAVKKPPKPPKPPDVWRAGMLAKEGIPYRRTPSPPPSG